jgi:putative transposase
LEQLEEIHGLPQAIRLDNGSELGAAIFMEWCMEKGIELKFIQPGKPQQNAYVERFNRTVRYKWLSQHYWQSIDEVQMFATQWMYKYNHQLPNMDLGGIIPKQRLVMAT